MTLTRMAGRHAPWRIVAPTVALAALVVGTSWAVGGGWKGLGYLVLYLLATLPGWRIGARLFGRQHAAGWIAGALIGYGVTAVALWVPMSLGVGSPATLAAAWVVTCAATWLGVGRCSDPLVRLPPWTGRDTRALLLVLAMVPVLVGCPFARVGEVDRDGQQAYRAYFTADFLWHIALTAELSTLRVPPSDPYAAGHRVHYYWTYFLFPAAVVASAPARVAPEIGDVLKVNALAAGLLFVGMIAVFAWTVVPRAWAAATGVLLALLAASAEGVFALVRTWARGQPLAAVRELNVDAMTLWVLNGLTIDGLPRSLWYTPQHAGACAFGLIALTMVAAAGGRAGAAARLWAGVALAFAVAFSPFLGGAFTLVFAMAVTSNALLDQAEAVRRIAGHLLAAVPVALGVAWVVANDMLEGARGALVLGFAGHARHAPVATILLAIGPLLLPALAGLAGARGSARGVITAASGLVIGLGLFFLVSVAKTDPIWVGWRAGQIMLVMLPALVARFVAVSWDARSLRRLAGVSLALAFAVGLPTTIVDAFNAQDTSNRAMGPGFPWTVRITPAQRAAFAWIRRATPRDAVVQMEVTTRGRATWTLIPSFAHRRMAAGLPISLVAMPYYEANARRVRTLYGTTDAAEAWRLARGLRIDYLYVDSAERQAFTSESLAKFGDHPELFRPVYWNAEVSLYAVAKSPPL